jgi:hypothetical protein
MWCRLLKDFKANVLLSGSKSLRKEDLLKPVKNNDLNGRITLEMD